MGTLIIRNIDLELLEKQRGALTRTLIAMEIKEGDLELMEGLEAMLDAWSDERYHKAEAKRIALESIPPGAKLFTTEQAEARYRCSTCVEGGYCGYDCVEAATGSIRCLHCGERIWFAHSLSDHHNPFTCPYCGTEQSNKHLDNFND